MQDILVHVHPMGGHITLTHVSGTVQLDCRWPIDRDTDEWISVTDNYDVGIYANAIQDLIDTGSARLLGQFGHMKLDYESEVRTRLEVAVTRHALPRSLIMTIDKMAESFALDWA